jgi:uncharacterized protein YkwD
MSLEFLKLTKRIDKLEESLSSVAGTAAPSSAVDSSAALTELEAKFTNSFNQLRDLFAKALGDLKAEVAAALAQADAAASAKIAALQAQVDGIKQCECAAAPADEA